MSARDVVINLVTKKKGDGLKDVEKDLDSLGKKTEKTGGFFQNLTGKLGTFGDNVQKDLTGKLGPAGDMLDKTGVGLGDMSTKAALAGGAVVALGGFVASGVGKLKDLYDATRNFNEVAGTSWEEGSKLIAVFDDLRVSSEEGASAMGKLTKTVGDSPEKLKAYGIEVAHAKDGTVDMAATLANVATAFQQTTDPAKRAALGSELFGKSWQNMIPVLQRGGKELQALIDGVDESQVATAKGAEQQDELFEATDNLHDAIDGLQRELATALIPTLAEAAKGTTTLVNAFGTLKEWANKIGPPMDDAEDHAIRFGKASDHVSQATIDAAMAVDGMIKALGPTATQAIRLAGGSLANMSEDMELTKRRTDEAKGSLDRFRQSVKDLLDQQEAQRLASLALEDSTLALEQAEIDAGDASFELSEKTRETSEAIAAHGVESDEAKIAVEEHRRAVAEAQQAMNGAAGAAVQLAKDQAAAAGTSLTAGQETKVYRDELIKLRDGVADPALAAAMDAQIERLRLIAERAESAAAQAHALTQAMNDASGIERSFTSRNAGGEAVVRRATGGAVWPGRSYLVGEHGPEMLRFDGTGPGEVLSTPQSQRAGDWPILSGGGKGSSPTVTRDAAGNIIDITGPQNFGVPGVSSPLGSSLAFPSLRSSPAGVRGGSSQVLGTRSVPGFELPASPYGGAGGGSGGPNFFITINGYADLGKLISAIKQYEAARK